MASICKINGKWRALIRRKGYKPVAKYFDTKKDADAWARMVESSIDQTKAVVLSDSVTVGSLIAEFRRLRLEAGRPVAPESNAHYMLEHLTDDLGADRVVDLTPDRLVRWAKYRKQQGAGPYTVNMELSQLGTVIRHTSSFLNLTLPDVVGRARPQLHYLQLIGGGNRRSRRPTEDERAALFAALDARNPIISDAVRVARITALRRGELARIRWADLDARKRAVLVRQRKHPRQIEARDEWVPLLGDAWEIVQRQPRIDERIFPVSKEALTDAVTETTRALGIPDLRLHDMRREATSRLREMGFDQHERKAITGHRSDRAHEIYISVTLESLHEKYAALLGKKQGRRRRKTDPDRQP